MNTDTNFFDDLKAKLSNPILFTYFCYFAFVNYRNILFLLKEPLRYDHKNIATRFELIHDWDFYCWPLALTALSFAFRPMLNHAANLAREYWDSCYEKIMHKWQPTRYVEKSELDNLQNNSSDKINGLRDALRNFELRNSKTESELKIKSEALAESEDNISKLETKISKYEGNGKTMIRLSAQCSQYETTIRDIARILNTNMDDSKRKKEISDLLLYKSSLFSDAKDSSIQNENDLETLIKELDSRIQDRYLGNNSNN